MSLKASRSSTTDSHSTIKPEQNDQFMTPAFEQAAMDGPTVSPDRVMRLQRTMGNQATIQFIKQAQHTPHVQRLKKDKKTSKLVETIAEEIGAVESDVLACYEWAAVSTDFEAFTGSKENLTIFLSLREKVPDCTAVNLREQAGGDSGQLVSTAIGLIEFATQKKIVKEKPKTTTREREIETPSTKVPEELSFGESQIVAPTRPSVGSSFDDLDAIDGGAWPATFASTVFAIGGFRVNPATLLSGGKGTTKETVEVKITLLRAKPRKIFSFVVHYHPKAEIPEGALSGESDIHVKGDRYVKHHESMPEDTLTGQGIPSLQAIKDLDLQ